MSTPSPQDTLIDIAFGFMRARTLFAFAELQIADHITEGKTTVAELSTATETHAPFLDRLLHASATLGVVQSQDGKFTLTPLGEALRSGVPGSMQGMFRAFLGAGHYGAWGNIVNSLKKGVTAFDDHFKEPIWSYFSNTAPAEGKLFNQFMSDFSAPMTPAITAAYSFPQNGTLVDVAGGNGTLLCAALEQQPGLKGIVTDLPHTMPAAEEYIAAKGMSGRAEAMAANFFERVPEGADAYMMKFILHDWDDEKAAAILQTIRKAAKPESLLILVENVVPEEDLPGPARMMDINMMVMCGGKERTASEWDTLLSANGFQLIRIVPTECPLFVLEARVA